MISVETDANSGFCPGVIRVVDKAEECLALSGHLYSLGAIVHNGEELDRLRSMGLETIDDMGNVSPSPGEKLLVRAHGEPPERFREAAERGFDVIDCTCPVVLRLQKDIREAYARTGADGGRIILFGKIGHAEVLGLVGQAGGDVTVVENMEQLERVMPSLDRDTPLEVFSQTTMDPDRYAEICGCLESNFRNVRIHSTICAQVSTRHRKLSDFARSHDVIVFVSGKSSSNGRVLCELCRSNNPRTYHIESVSDIEKGWFTAEDRVGVCGATSTPKWLLEEVAARIENLQ